MEAFTRKLTEKATRTIREKQGTYLMLFIEYCGVKLLICGKRGEHAYIAKIHLEENTPSLHCREIEYSPLGLYIFGREEEDLALKTLEKIHWFIKSRKNLLCGA
jgi:hypothetical protein